ncbi:MAG: ABC transporter, partial [Novosphingobium sp.]|nr:ABC transporter [Novosphingobium sp.]
MIWKAASAYPRQIIIAFLALLTTSSATIAIPARFKVIIDKAFGANADVHTIDASFRYLLMIVIVLGLATAVRFYFVSWLGERVVADVRLRVQENLLRLSPSFFEENSPKEIS